MDSSDSAQTPYDDFVAQSTPVPPDAIFTSAAEKYGRGDPQVFSALLRGIYKVESNNGKNTDHRDPVTGASSGAAGPMGLMPAVQRMYGVTDPNDFGQSVAAAAQYLAKGYDDTGSLSDALRFYHGGPNRRLWGRFTNTYPVQVQTAAQVAPEALATKSAFPAQSAVDDFVNSIKLPDFSVEAPGAKAPVSMQQPTTVKPAPAAPSPFGPWTGEKELANSVLLNFGPQVQGGASWLAGGNYNDTVREGENARREWLAAHPGTGLATDLFGALPATLAGEGLLVKGVQAGAGALTRAVPALAPAVAATGRFLGGAAGTGRQGISGVALRSGSRAASGAAQGSAIGALQSNLFDQPLGKQITTGAELGAVLNPFLAPVAEGAMRLFKKGDLAPQSAVDPAVAKVAEDASKLDVHLRGGQIAQDARVQAFDAKRVPPEANIAQINDLHRSYSHTFGEDTDHFSPDVLQNARKRIGQTLSQLGSKYDTQFSSQGLTDLGHFNTAVGSDVDLNDASRKLIEDAYKELTDHIALNNGVLSGKMYDSFTQGGGALAKLLYNKNETVRSYGEQLRDIIDNEVTSSNPGVPQAWKDARSQWRNLNIAERWVKNSANGQGDPQKLLSVVQGVSPATAQGQNPVSTLARAGRLMSTAAPTVQGGIKAKGNPLSVMLENPVHGLLGLGGAFGAFEGAKELLPLIQEHPFTTTAAAVGGLAAKAISNIAKRKLESDLVSPEYTMRLLHGSNGQQYFVNPILPLIPRSTDTYEEPAR